MLGQLFAIRLTLNELLAVVGADFPIAPDLKRAQVRGVEVFEELGAQEASIDHFVELMGGFIAAAGRRR